jgi:hypothetical protein
VSTLRVRFILLILHLCPASPDAMKHRSDARPVE